jgi:hypothetical protein
MNRIKIFIGISCLLTSLTLVATTTVKQTQFDYYQKGSACVAIPETNCLGAGTIPCYYFDQASGVNYRIYETRNLGVTCIAPLYCSCTK